MELENNEQNSDVNLEQQSDTVAKTYDSGQSQLQWMNKQVSNLERQLLLNNRVTSTRYMSNWTKVILTALSVILPGIGQIVGIIIGLIFVSNDIDSDKRTFGAALLTVSIVAFVILSLFWFVVALALGPQLYY